jgi:hypothetical protein
MPEGSGWRVTHRKRRTGKPRGRPISLLYTGPEGQAVCTRCQCLKPLSDFRPDRRKPGRLDPMCRACYSQASRDWAKAHPERRAYHEVRQYAYRYGLDRDEVSAYWQSHSGLCDICGGTQDPAAGGRRLDIEHDHAGGEFRGMTCNDCNNIMKFAKDDVERLVKVIAYLIDPPARSQPPFRLF